MKYMGSKNRIAKYILPIILKGRGSEQWYVEPFVGGANMIDKVEGNRIGADVNGYVIDALIDIRDSVGVLPKNKLEFTEEEYKKLRSSEEYIHKGFAGFAYSYAGKWLGGWCRDAAGKRDYVKEAYKNAVKQSANLKIILVNKGYADLALPKNSIIYCDPPYKGTTSYKDAFDHPAFWQWCRAKSDEGHEMYISEYNAPEDFVCVCGRKRLIARSLKTQGVRKVLKNFLPIYEAN